MQRLWLPIVISLVLMTACTTEDPVTDVPFSTATPRIIGTVEAPVSIGDSAIPSDFTAGEPLALESLGTFNISISGDLETVIDSGTSVYNYLPDSGFLPARNQLFISSSDAIASQQIAFNLAPGLQPGEYNIVSPEDYSPVSISASYSRLRSVGLESYIDNIEGTMTLSRAGEIISGDFQFRAEFTETNEDGEFDTKTIAVIGSFENIPYQSTLDDPFEVIVPLPTRNFVEDSTQEP